MKKIILTILMAVCLTVSAFAEPTFKYQYDVGKTGIAYVYYDYVTNDHNDRYTIITTYIFTRGGQAGGVSSTTVEGWIQ